MKTFIAVVAVVCAVALNHAAQTQPEPRVIEMSARASVVIVAKFEIE